MARYEYKVCAAPARGLKGKGLKTAEARFAHAVEGQINRLAAEGWQYQRTDILPSEERQGLTSSHTVYRTLMVFRRPLAGGQHPAVPAETDAAPDDDDPAEADADGMAAARAPVAPDDDGHAPPEPVGPPRAAP